MCHFPHSDLVNNSVKENIGEISIILNEYKWIRDVKRNGDLKMKFFSLLLQIVRVAYFPQFIFQIMAMSWKSIGLVAILGLVSQSLCVPLDGSVFSKRSNLAMVIPMPETHKFARSISSVNSASVAEESSDVLLDQFSTSSVSLF